MHDQISAIAPRQCCRVLVIEDDTSLSGLIARNLSVRGHSVRTALNEISAVAAIRDEMPEVIILDVNLPDGTGWDVLRTAEVAPSTRVIMLTGTPVSPKRLAEFRPVAYLPKPFPLEALLRLVEQHDRATEDHDDGST